MADDNAPESSLVETLALKAAHGGQREHDALINAFLDAVAVVPSGTDPGSGPFEPVLVEIDGVTHMLVCDSLAAVRKATDLATFAVSMKGIDIVRGVTPGNALLIRTPKSGFSIDEQLLDEIRSRR